MSYKKEEYRPRLSEEENEIITQHSSEEPTEAIDDE